MGSLFSSAFIYMVLWTTSILAADWKPTGLIQCRTNDDCKNERHCCSVTPALGRRSLDPRQIPDNWDGMVHYCLPWKNENATWCELRMQYSPSTSYYYGLCPCGPGLTCVPTQNLDPKYYPRDRFGQCANVSSSQQ